MPLVSIARQLIGRVLDHYDYALKDKLKPLRGPREFFAMLEHHGFVPETVFDVGVAHGTPWLYEAFPEAYFVLVEANADFAPALEQILARYRGERHVFAAGAEVSTGKLQINRVFQSSSGLAPVARGHVPILVRNGVERDVVEREVPIRPLDTVMNPKLKPPYLVKLDVEGYEAEVLKGAEKILAETEVIVTEISVRRRFENELLFAEFVGYMDKLGFDFFDIVDLFQMSRDGPLIYMDAVFVKRNGKLSEI